MKHSHFLFGTHACAAALANPARNIKRVLVSKSAQQELDDKPVDAQLVEQKKLESLLPPGAVHQGIAVECDPLDQPSLEEWLMEHQQPVILLDQVTDPHNIGAILRSAAAFNIGAVIATERHAPAETGVMAKSASGAMECVPYIMVGNLVQSIDKLKKADYWIYGLDGTAKQSIGQVKFDTKTALVMGAEGKGLRRLTAEHCDMLMKLPISNRMESLNVSNAAAIAMYELSRART